MKQYLLIHLALADGVLVDVTELAKEACLKICRCHILEGINIELDIYPKQPTR